MYICILTQHISARPGARAAHIPLALGSAMQPPNFATQPMRHAGVLMHVRPATTDALGMYTKHARVSHYNM
jgi:hypothetical protein